jgi:RNA polymerase sigma-70 factor (ECF subfamily)
MVFMDAPTPEPDVAPGTPRETAIPLLYDRHAPMIRGLAWRMAGSEDEADEILQDTFLEAYKSWHNFEGRSRASTWLGGIAIRQWKRRHRRRVGEPQRMPSIDDLLPFGETTSSILPGHGETPLEENIRREAATAVHRAILELPEDFRVPLVMKEMLEIPVNDVADALGLNPQTVKTRLHRARLRIREAMRSTLPQSPAVDPAYDRQTCIDLLHAKLEAQDAGRDFPVTDDFLCERCAAVFQELDAAVGMCRTCENLAPRPESRSRLLADLGVADSPPPPETTRDCGCP